MISYPFDSQITGYAEDGSPIYDRAADSSVLRRWMANYFTDGVFHGVNSMGMRVTPGAGMEVSVSPGAVSIQGAIGIEDVARKLVLSASGTSARIDTVVARLNLETDVRSVDLYVVTGTPSQNPVRPSLTRNMSIWELGLADIRVNAGSSQLTITDITDTRYDQTRCGAVSCPLSQIDTSTILEQWNAKLAELEQLLVDVPNGTSPNSLLLNGKPASHYMQPMNLLYNSDFEHFVAQAGIGGNHCGNQAYAGDGWILLEGTVTGEINADGRGYRNITLNGTICQVVDSPPDVATVGVNMISGSAEVSYVNGEVMITSSGGVIKNVVLFSGRYTELPMYHPKGYFTELQLCQYYYMHVTGIINLYGYSTEKGAYVTMPIPTMRLNVPTVECDNTFTLRGNGSTYTGYELNSVSFVKCGMLRLNIAKQSGTAMGENRAVCASVSSDTIFKISADLPRS